MSDTNTADRTVSVGGGKGGFNVATADEMDGEDESEVIFKIDSLPLDFGESTITISFASCDELAEQIFSRPSPKGMNLGKIGFLMILCIGYLILIKACALS